MFTLSFIYLTILPVCITQKNSRQRRSSTWSRRKNNWQRLRKWCKSQSLIMRPGSCNLLRFICVWPRLSWTFAGCMRCLKGILRHCCSALKPWEFWKWLWIRFVTIPWERKIIRIFLNFKNASRILHQK